MKIVKVIAILTLLVGFPAISYLYLMRGYNFRLEALQELEAKKNIATFAYGDLDRSLFLDKATLVFNGEVDNALGYVQPVFDEFSQREEFQVLGFYKDSSGMSQLPVSNQWRTVIADYPYDGQLALVDTSADIRNYYDFDSTSFTKLVQHIPIIIPRKKEEDIVLKREDEK